MILEQMQDLTHLQFDCWMIWNITLIIDNFLILNLMSLAPLKENNVSVSPSKEMRKLRIQLADRNFDLKKMEEDHAEQKAHLIIQHNHDKNNYHQTIKDLKEKIADENQQWTSKVDEIRKDRDQQIHALNQTWHLKLQTQIASIQHKLSQEYKDQIERLKLELGEQKREREQERRDWGERMEKMKEEGRMRIERLKEEQRMGMEELERRMKREEDLKIKELMETKVNEGKKFKEISSAMRKKQDESENIIKKHEMELKVKKQSITQLKESIEQLKKQNRELEDTVKALTQSHRQEICEKEQHYEQKISSLQNQFKENIEALNSKWKNEYRKVQQANERIQNACNEKERLWEERGKKVLEMYQRREARQEDVKIIEHLQVQLIKKEFQLEREKQQLKTCKLELDNMDEIYKRIFYSAQKPYKQSSSFHLKRVRLPGLLNKSSHPVKNTLDD